MAAASHRRSTLGARRRHLVRDERARRVRPRGGFAAEGKARRGSGRRVSRSCPRAAGDSRGPRPRRRPCDPRAGRRARHRRCVGRRGGRRRGREGRSLRPRAHRPAVGRPGPRTVRPGARRAPRHSAFHDHHGSADRRRTTACQARTRRRLVPVRVDAAAGAAHHPERHQPAALRDPERHHGGEEEGGARGGAGGAGGLAYHGALAERAKGKQSGRTQEIQRLIGRSLRAMVDLEKLGENTIHIDCDVLQADGGTRTASITGAAIALVDALEKLQATKKLKADPLVGLVAAVSVGIKNGEVLLDLNYSEDSSCDTDLNVVMTQKGEFIEIQGTAEEKPFTRAQVDEMLAVAEAGIKQLIAEQQAVLGW